MKQYTFIMEYRGGTYISQVNDANVKSALLNWAKGLNIREIQNMGILSKNELIKLTEEEDEPTLISGMNNVWCVSGTLKAGSFIVNIVGCDRGW